MIYLLTYNDGYDSEFAIINAYQKLETLLSQIRKMEKNEDISLEMFEGDSFEEMVYEIEEEDSADDYGEGIYRYYKINKVMIID